MHLALFSVILLAHACAPSVAPETRLSVAQAESAFDPFSTGLNGPRYRALHLRALHLRDHLDVSRWARSLAERSVNFGVRLA